MLWLLLLSLLVSSEAQAQVDQVHLSITTDPSKWGVDCVAHVEGPIQIEFCTAGSCSTAFNVSSPVYIAEIGFLHQALLEGLQLKTEYTYRIATSTGLWTDDFHFTTGPYERQDFVRRGDSGGVGGAVVAVFADLGLYNGLSTSRLLNESIRHTFDYALHVGDMSYDLFSNASQVGNDYMNLMGPLMQSKPLMVAAG
jgi:hypothetical protein